MTAPSPLVLIGLIARQQAVQALAGSRGWLIVLAWTGLVALGCWSGAAAASQERAHYETGEAALRDAFDRWTRAYEADPYRPVNVSAEHPVVLHLPPAPARALAAGAADAAGSWAQPATYVVRELEGRKGQLTPLGALFGALDPAGLVAIAGALFAIALGFDAVAGERARGTLALHFVNPLGRGTFLAGKALGVLGAITAALWVPLVLALGIMAALGSFPAGSGWRVAGFALAALLYLAFWAAAAVAGSVLARTPATAFAGLVGLWLLLAIAVPKVAVAAAAARYPVAPPTVLGQRYQTLLKQAQDQYVVDLAAYKKTHPDPGPRDFARLRMGYFAGYFAAIDAARAPSQAALDARQRALDEAAAFSPAFDFQLIAAALAGTDGTRHRAFVAAADAYARELRLWPDRRFLAGGTTRPAFAELPPVGYREPDEAALAGDFARRLGLMLLAILLAALVAWGGFRRYDLRPAGG